MDDQVLDSPPVAAAARLAARVLDALAAAPASSAQPTAALDVSYRDVRWTCDQLEASARLALTPSGSWTLTQLGRRERHRHFARLTEIERIAHTHAAIRELTDHTPDAALTYLRRELPARGVRSRQHITTRWVTDQLAAAATITRHDAPGLL